MNIEGQLKESLKDEQLCNFVTCFLEQIHEKGRYLKSLTLRDKTKYGRRTISTLYPEYTTETKIIKEDIELMDNGLERTIRTENGIVTLVQYDAGDETMPNTVIDLSEFDCETEISLSTEQPVRLEGAKEGQLVKLYIWDNVEEQVKLLQETMPEFLFEMFYMNISDFKGSCRVRTRRTDRSCLPYVDKDYLETVVGDIGDDMKEEEAKYVSNATITNISKPTFDVYPNATYVKVRYEDKKVETRMEVGFADDEKTRTYVSYTEVEDKDDDKLNYNLAKTFPAMKVLDILYSHKIPDWLYTVPDTLQCINVLINEEVEYTLKDLVDTFNVQLVGDELETSKVKLDVYPKKKLTVKTARYEVTIEVGVNSKSSRK